MSILAMITASAICTSSLAVSGDPHNRLHVTRVSLDEHTLKAEIKEYRFRAMDAWGVDNIEELLVDANLTGPARMLEIEEVLHQTTDSSKTFELYHDNGWQWTLKAMLRIDGAKGEYEVEHDYETNITKMTCI